MTEGSKDRFVNTVGGSGGGGNVTITGLTSPNPFPVDDAQSQVQLAAILAALIAGIGVTQLTSPWVVSGTVAVTGTQTDALTDTQLRASPVPVSGTVSVTEPVSVDDNGGSLTVDALNLDIRDLTFAADKVDASASAMRLEVDESGTPADNLLNGNGLLVNQNGVGFAPITFPYMFDGTFWDRVRGNSTDGLLVNLGSNNDVTGRTDGFNGVIKDNAGTDSTVKVAHLDMTTATTTTIVAAVAGKTIRVLAFTVGVTSGTVDTTINFARGAGTTRITGSSLIRTLLAAAENFAPTTHAAPTGAFLFETADSENLRVTQSAAGSISVSVVYIEVN